MALLPAPVLAHGAYGDHMGGWDWFWGFLTMVLVVVLAGAVVWAVVRSTQREVGHPHHRAREILAERLARGEITPEEFEELSRHL
jgi:putative membrane protein